MKFSRSLKYFLLGFLITAIAIVSVSCSKDDKKKSAVTARTRTTLTPNVGGTPGCPNCSSSSLIATSLGESLQGQQDQFQIGLDFFYVGNQNQIAADGVLYINNLSPFGQCYFNPGGYTVRTVSNQYGQQLESHAVTNVGLEAVNGTDIIKMRVDYASFDGLNQASLLDCNGDNYESALLGSIVIESVNGRLCGFNGITKTISPVGQKGFNCNSY